TSDTWLLAARCLTRLKILSAPPKLAGKGRYGAMMRIDRFTGVRPDSCPGPLLYNYSAAIPGALYPEPNPFRAVAQPVWPAVRQPIKAGDGGTNICMVLPMNAGYGCARVGERTSVR